MNDKQRFAEITKNINKDNNNVNPPNDDGPSHNGNGGNGSEPSEPKETKRYYGLIGVDFVIALFFGTWLQDVVPGGNSYVAHTLLGPLIIGTSMESLKFSALLGVLIGGASVGISSAFWIFVFREGIHCYWRLKLADPQKAIIWFFLKIGYAGILGAECFFLIKRLEMAANCPFCPNDSLSTLEMVMFSVITIFITTAVGVINGVIVNNDKDDE